MKSRVVSSNSSCVPDHQWVHDTWHPAPHRILGNDSKTGRPHQLPRRPVAAATAGEAAPRAEQVVLPRRKQSRACPNVFDEQQPPTGAKHAGDLAKGAFWILDGAQDKSRDDGVNGFVGQW
jgi:hypothetical protein